MRRNANTKISDYFDLNLIFILMKTNHPVYMVFGFVNSEGHLYLHLSTHMASQPPPA